MNMYTVSLIFTDQADQASKSSSLTKKKTETSEHSAQFYLLYLHKTRQGQ